MDVLADAELAPMARAEAARTEEERRYLALWEQGIKDPVALADALGIKHLSEEEQERQRMKTHKRIMKRLERFGQRWSNEGST
jgi:hypothetical protein